MDIETIEKIVTSIIARLQGEEANVSTFAALPLLQCQMLLHIYHKLEDIDERLIAQLANEWEDYKRGR